MKEATTLKLKLDMSNISCFLSNFHKRFALFDICFTWWRAHRSQLPLQEPLARKIYPLSLFFSLINQTQFLHLRGETVMENPEAADSDSFHLMDGWGLFFSADENIYRWGRFYVKGNHRVVLGITLWFIQIKKELSYKNSMNTNKKQKNRTKYLSSEHFSRIWKPCWSSLFSKVTYIQYVLIHS